MGLLVSTYYYKPGNKDHLLLEDKTIVSEIEEILEIIPQSGYRPVTDILKRKRVINHKKVSRIMRENNLLCRKIKGFKTSTTDSKHGLYKFPNLLLDKEKINKAVIVGDVTYYDIKGKNHYLAHLMDLSNRETIGAAISNRLDKELVLAALKNALQNRGTLEGYIHHTDTDSRYCSAEYIKALKNAGAEISMCKGNAYENAHSESFNKTIKRQEINIHQYQSKEESAESIFRFIEIYNTYRPHSALGGMSPLEYRKIIQKL